MDIYSSAVACNNNRMTLATEFALVDILATLNIPALMTSLVLLGALLTARIILIKAVKRRAEILSKDQRRWINRIKNSFFIILFIGLVMIWAPELQTFALSLTAVAVAVVVATKEMILCLTGGFMRVTTRPFQVGDWVYVDGVYGEVIDINAFAFLLQEVDIVNKTYQYTGHTIEVPNSKFFTNTIENLESTKNHVFLEVPITVQYADLDPERLIKELESIASEQFKSVETKATSYLRKVERKAGVALPQAKPQILLRTTDLGHTVYTARLFVPTVQAAAIHRAITQKFLSYIYKQREAREKAKEKQEKAASRPERAGKKA